MSRFIITVTMCCLMLGCGENTSQKEATMMESSKTTTKEATRGTVFTGRVVFVDLEGGFWGVITDKGAKLDGGVPPNLRIHNQRVRGAYRVNKDLASFRMWGELVQFSELEAIGPLGELVEHHPNES